MSEPRARRLASPPAVVVLATAAVAAASLSTITLAATAAATAEAAARGSAGTVTQPMDWTLSDGRTVRTWQEGDAGRFFAIERPDGTWTDDRRLDPVIHLRYGRFDPLAALAADADPGAPAGDAPAAPDAPAAAGPAVPPALAQSEDARLRIVQLRTQWLDDYRAELEALGVEVHQHLPATARLVRMDAEQAAAVAALPFVRWVGPYHPAYRVDERLLAEFDGAGFGGGARRVDVRLVDPPADRPAFAAAVAALGGTVERLDAGALISEVTIDGDQLPALLALDEVLFVDPWGGAYETDMAIARDIGGASELETIAGFDGEGVRGEVMDNGFNVGHQDFQARPLIQHGATNSESHGAATSGIVFGDGTGGTQYRGLLPEGQGIVADYDSVGIGGPSRYDHTAELVTPPYEAVFQSNSFGSPRTTQYTNRSAEMDAIIFDVDIAITQSQSNAGSQQSRPQAWAKNIISVGGVDHENTLSKADDRWTGASIGPAADGRIKPDLTHFYDSIDTTSCCGIASYTSSFGGTSGATPIVAGYLGLFHDMWADGIFGNEVVPGAGVFANRSAQSTAKAFLINTAVPYDWTQGGPNGNLTRPRQGWGMPSAIAMWEQRERTLVVDEEVVLGNLQSHTELVTVLPGEPALRVTLTWADPPGTTSSVQHRINDLDLVVTSPDGTVYRGNVGLLDGIWSEPDGERNTIDTVENVFVESPAPGPWTIRVEASELNVDGHVETPQLDADFALVSTGGAPIPPTLVVQLESAVPPLQAPGTPVTVEARVTDGLETLDPATTTLSYRLEEGAPLIEVPLLPTDGDPELFTAEIPGEGCGPVSFFLSATSTDGTVITAPPSAPDVTFGYGVGVVEPVASFDMEEDAGFTVSGDVTAGAWVRGVPTGVPSNDGDGSGQCWVTGGPGENVDEGSTVLTVPPLVIESGSATTLRYLRYVAAFGMQGGDGLATEVSLDGGATWEVAEQVSTLQAEWTPVEINLLAFGEPTDEVRVRFTATDLGAPSGLRVAIDGLELEGAICGGEPADVNGDGTVGFDDLLGVLAAFGTCDGCPEDVDGDGTVGFDDVLEVLAAWE